MKREYRYETGQLILFNPEKKARHKIPKGFYIIVCHTLEKMLLAPMRKTELIKGKDGKYLIYEYSGARSLHIEISSLHPVFNKKLVPDKSNVPLDLHLLDNERTK